jgi:hypothetical protein
VKEMHCSKRVEVYSVTGVARANSKPLSFLRDGKTVRKRSFVLVFFPAFLIIWIVGWLLYWTGNKYTGIAPSTHTLPEKDQVTVGLLLETETSIHQESC